MSKSSDLHLGDFNCSATVDDSFIRKAFLQKQYFPHVKTEGEEFPPFFNSGNFTPDVADQLANIQVKELSETAWVELRTRRFDGLVRRLGLPHPVTYSRLVNHIADNWKHLSYLIESDHSRIKPQWHEDGRLIHMNYESTEEQLSRRAQHSHGKYFLVKADISNCFPSMYSHAIDWALRGKQVAKTDRTNKSWQARVDAYTRKMHEGETKGLMIGPAISNLLAEIVLQKIDEHLVSESVSFTRYIDDYSVYCNDRSDAEQFIVKLNRALSEYRLDINRKKTEIYDLWRGDSEAWMQEVYSYLPEALTPERISRFLRSAEQLSHTYKSKSVLKFAVKLIVGRQESARRPISILELDELARICQFHPHLVPFLCRQLGDSISTLSKADVDRIGALVSHQMNKAADRDETDTTLWYLYILRKLLDRPVSAESCNNLLEMKDDLVSVAIASTCDEHRDAVADHVRSWQYHCNSDREKHWLVRYELWRTKLLGQPDLGAHEEEWMRILLGNGVKFSELQA